MRTITVPKDELKKTLKKNRKKHRELFEEALEGFRIAAISNFESRINQIKDGGKVELYVDLSVPEDHTDDYDRVLDQLKWEITEEIELTDQEFRNYIQDDWNWVSKFSTDNALYSQVAAAQNKSKK